MSKKVSVGFKVFNQFIQPVVTDVTKDDSVESNLEKAIQIADLGDLTPGNGVLDMVVTVKLFGGVIKVPIVLMVDVID